MKLAYQRGVEPALSAQIPTGDKEESTGCAQAAFEVMAKPLSCRNPGGGRCGEELCLQVEPSSGNRGCPSTLHTLGWGWRARGRRRGGKADKHPAATPHSPLPCRILSFQPWCPELAPPSLLVLDTPSPHTLMSASLGFTCSPLYAGPGGSRGLSCHLPSWTAEGNHRSPGDKNICNLPPPQHQLPSLLTLHK